MNVLDLFAGIGGFSFAAHRLGWKTKAFCEQNNYCTKVLKKNFPNVPIYPDVRRIEDFTKYAGTINVICGGYPCQPFSQAGKQEGERDDRHLWPAMFEIIQKIRPNWVIAENVIGHISMGLDSVLSDLESEGYTTQSIVIPACAVFAIHRRERVWVISHNKSKRQKRPKVKVCTDKIRALGTKQPRGLGNSSDRERRGFYFESNILRTHDGVPIELDRTVTVPNRAERVQALGNAIHPEVAFQIFRRINLIEYGYCIKNL